MMGSELLQLPKLGTKQKSTLGESLKSEKSELTFNKELFENLRTLRKKMADKEGLPPFVIFGNATLQEMSYYFPANEQDLLHINGVGATKIKRYGKKFLKAITDFSKEHNIKPVAIPVKVK